MALQTQQYIPSAYNKLYCKLDNRLNTQVQSISVTFDDGGKDESTIVLDYAGRSQGAAMSKGVLKGLVPYILTDAAGGGQVGLLSAGIVTGKGIMIPSTLLTGQNLNGNLPVNMLLLIGQPAAQKIQIPGCFFSSFTIEYAIGSSLLFTANFSGQFPIIQ